MSQVIRPPAVYSPASNAPVLITEKQVALGTAAAVSVDSRRRRWLTTALLTSIGRVLTQPAEPRPYPRRREAACFEAARMSREMDRL
ncbi:MAG: hypothetical protein JWP83_1340 [Mycobacterium sp.]|jgi:hypothetical protein|nr:hypothetical protein [Mycobacterium sp.]